MTKIVEFDLSNEDEEIWEGGGGQSEAPSPGIYQAVVEQINPGFSKGDDGKPDKSRPRLEVIYKITGDADGDPEGLAEAGNDGGSCLNAWVWDYVSFSKASAWKQAEFFKAIGEANPLKGKKGKKGKFNAEKHEGSTEVRIRIKPGSYEGNYQARVGGTWPWDDAGGEVDGDLADEIADELGDGNLTADDIRDMKVAELKEVASANDISLKGLKKDAAIEKILEELGLDEDEEEPEEDEDWDEMLDEDEEDEEPEYTADDIREMSPKDLKALAKEAGVSLKGMKKSEAIDALIEELGLEDDDEVPF